MKNFRLCFFFCSLLFPVCSFAMHIVGSSMSYKYLKTNTNGTKTWQIEVVILRDCNGGGAPFDTRMNIGIYKGTMKWTSGMYYAVIAGKPVCAIAGRL